jgi:tRNA (guanine37-N1)-methyltransferase
MRVDILTLFPALFDGFRRETLIKQAAQKGLLDLNVWHLRSWARSKHQQVDDYPFGGGPGMVLMPEPLFLAVEDLLKDRETKPVTIYFSPAGELLNQDILNDLSKVESLIFICGRYKGIDHRVIDELVDREISIGDYVLSGGELPAMVMLEGLTRLIPGVISDITSAETDSFYNRLLEGPIYTRPEVFRDLQVPEILVSGDHKKIADWNKKQALEATRKRRPDLWQLYLEKSKSEDK